MAISPDDIKNRFPLPAYNFKVRMGSENYGFSQVSGLNLQYETITYRTGLSHLEGDFQMPGRKQAVNVTLERGVVRQGSRLLEWISTIQMSMVNKEDLIIDLCGENGEPLVSWTVQNAFPTQLEAPGFDANTNEVAIERLHLIGSGLKIEYHS
jgi:phage tail-like protein